MAKVNKKPFHCIPLAAFAHNSHSTLSSKVRKVEESAPLVSELKSSNWEGFFFLLNGRFVKFFCAPSTTDVPEGFSVNQLEEAREGGDLHLTCSANKYLYTALSWQRLNATEESRTPVWNIHHLEPGEFSNSVVLMLENLTDGDSGVYRCSALHIISGRELHLDTQVEVTSESL